MAPIGVAIIGGGLFAKLEHLPAVLKCDSLALKAIYSRSLKSAKDTAALIDRSDVTADLYSNDSGAGKAYKDLLARDDIAAVIVALPINSQPEYIEAALDAGKHVLAEKPIAKDLATAKKLIAYYKNVSATNPAVTFAVAENFRFQPLWTFAAKEAAKLGKVTHFTAKIFSLTKMGTMWYETEWRKKPEYQGGFLLDGGVHHAAATRMLLAGENKPASVRAFTSLAREWLPPIDSVNAIIKTQAGASGTFQNSAGTLLEGMSWDIGFEKATMSVGREDVTIKLEDGEPTTTHIPKTSGVSEEVAAWAEAILAGTPNPLQSPEEALADLEFMEMMFRSGDEDGAPKTYTLQ